MEAKLRHRSIPKLVAVYTPEKVDRLHAGKGAQNNGIAINPSNSTESNRTRDHEGNSKTDHIFQLRDTSRYQVRLESRMAVLRQRGIFKEVCNK